VKYFPLLMCWVLAACAAAPPAKVDQHFGIWRGRNINDMVMHFGAAGSQREQNGMHYAEWTRQATASSPSLSIGVGGFGSHVGGSVGTTLFGGTKLNYCTVQAVYNASGLIEQIHWSGDTDLCLKQFPAK